MEYYRLEALVNRTRDDATLKLQCLFRMRLARAKLRQWIGALTKIQARKLKPLIIKPILSNLPNTVFLSFSI
jgi:hypothetical protein